MAAQAEFEEQEQELIRGASVNLNILLTLRKILAVLSESTGIDIPADDDVREHDELTP